MVNSPLNTTPAPEVTGHPPLLDLTALDDLLAELDQDETALDGFVDAFLQHWPERLLRAEASISAGDSDAVLDCALSIKVASEMVGAAWLSHCGGELESMARSGRLDQAAVLLETVRAVGNETRVALAAARNRGLAA
ncbi:Hpt domain-containing protein [Mycetocola sp. 2940]|uniref:Hpt domain-containing protein n=1 Tax=Mycetocola sp. 2940 TaxID=3156452 RepID=UPI00339B6F0B